MVRRNLEWALVAWREAERMLAESDPGSPEWRVARAELIRAKDRFNPLTAGDHLTEPGQRGAMAALQRSSLVDREADDGLEGYVSGRLDG